MTNREFFEGVINHIHFNGMMTEEAVEALAQHAEKELEKLDARNAKRSSKPTKAQLENEPIKESLLEILAVQPMTASQIHEANPDLSTQKISSLCRQLVDAGKLTVQEVKIPKKGKQKQYSIVSE